MLMKISGLARILYILLAIIAGFVAMAKMVDVSLILVVLGVIAGISLPKERMVLAAATIIALPFVGAALAQIPIIGAQLTAVTANLQLGMAGAFASAMAIMLYALVMESFTGMLSSAATGEGRATAVA